MTLRDLFGGKEVQLVNNETKKITGKIIHLSDKGWGFISSPDLEFERIFFHWSGLEQETKRFKELEKGMKVEFIPKEWEDKETGKSKGYRAIHIMVVADGE